MRQQQQQNDAGSAENQLANHFGLQSSKDMNGGRQVARGHGSRQARPGGACDCPARRAPRASTIVMAEGAATGDIAPRAEELGTRRSGDARGGERGRTRNRDAMPGAGSGTGAIDGLGVTGPMADARRATDPGAGMAPHDAAATPARNACSTISHTAINDRRNGTVRGKSRWHGNLSHGTLAQHLAESSALAGRQIDMANRESALIEITPEVLLKAYACGIFPMAESAEDPALFWIEPEKRGVIPLDRFHVPARLARTVRSDRFTVTVDRDFDAVLDGCAEPWPGRPRTWINARIRTLYRKLYERRHCHSLEVYEGDESGRRTLRRHAWPRFLRREHVPPRARRVQGRAGPSGRSAQGRRLQAPGYAIRYRSSARHLAPSKCRGGNITSCWKQRSPAKATLPRST